MLSAERVWAGIDTGQLTAVTAGENILAGHGIRGGKA